MTNMTLIKNYIFDLYGTLIDIHTDEEDPYLWKTLSSFYVRFGADYSPSELKQAYHQKVDEELDKVHQTGIKYADIRLEKVFYRLLVEAPHKHQTELSLNSELEIDTWMKTVANLFRELSMRRFFVFEGVHETLKTLKESGAHIYLLSNAQRVFTIPEIEKAGLKDYFDAIYISSDYLKAKPEPSFMKALLDEQGLDPKQCVMVGNDPNSDMAIALSCGVKGILLNTDCRNDEQLAKLSKDNKYKIIRSGHIEEILDLV